MGVRFKKSIARPGGFPLRAVCALCAEEDFFAVFVTDAGRYSCAIGSERHVLIPEAKGAFVKIEAFHAEADADISGYLGYDLKNDLEDLVSANEDPLEMPTAAFFEPKFWLEAEGNQAVISGKSDEATTAFAERLKALPEERNGRSPVQTEPDITLSPRTDRSAYLAGARNLMSHIQRGDIYEVNYCIQFTGAAPSFDPLSAFIALQERTEAPMSVFSRMGPYHILSASPERFLKKSGDTLCSQPIKGTARRSPDAAEDTALAEALRNDPKERSENVMITDLVRNDLSRVAERDSVKVKELFGIRSFKTVHHMVTTVTADLSPRCGPWDAVKACFPMGSMTGAPKISATELIDRSENFRRGAYSGAFGRISPRRDSPDRPADFDFDFNVMIRTLLYNSDKQLTALSVGSALTAAADPEKEYEECLLKARAIMEVLNPKLADRGVETPI